MLWGREEGEGRPTGCLSSLALKADHMATPDQRLYLEDKNFYRDRVLPASLFGLSPCPCKHAGDIESMTEQLCTVRNGHQGPQLFSHFLSPKGDQGSDKSVQLSWKVPSLAGPQLAQTRMLPLLSWMRLIISSNTCQAI